MENDQYRQRRNSLRSLVKAGCQKEEKSGGESETSALTGVETGNRQFGKRQSPSRGGLKVLHKER